MSLHRHIHQNGDKKLNSNANDWKPFFGFRSQAVPSPLLTLGEILSGYARAKSQDYTPFPCVNYLSYILSITRIYHRSFTIGAVERGSQTFLVVLGRSSPSTHSNLWGNLMPDNHWGQNAIEVRFAECGHFMWIPLGHRANHEHCYACHPELAQEPIPGSCPACEDAHRSKRAALLAEE